MSNGLPENRGVASITVYSSSNLYSLVRDQMGTVGLYRYDSNSGTWISASGGLSVTQRRSSGVSATDGSTVWLVQGYHGIGASSNGGQSWTGFNSSIPPQNVISMAGTSGGMLYVGCNSTPYSVGPNPTAMGVLSTADRADTWDDLNEGLSEFDMAVQGVAVSNKDTLIVLPYTGGLLMKKSPFSAWERQHIIHRGGTFGSIYKADDGTLLIGNYWTGVHISQDGYNWQFLNEGWPYGSGSGVLAKGADGVIYAFCGDQSGSKGLYRYSSSSGWTYLSFSGTRLTALLSTKNNTVLAATYDEIYISHDKGASWETFSNGLPAGTGAYAFLEEPDGTIYAATRGSVYGVHKYQTTGDRWESMGFPLNSNVTRVYSLSLMNRYLFAGTNNGGYHYSLENKYLVYVSKDGACG
nr:hypothetical protein [Planctomycetota bacterium]